VLADLILLEPEPGRTRIRRIWRPAAGRRAANRFPSGDRKTWRRPERSAGSARTSLRWPRCYRFSVKGARRRRASIRPWRGGRAGARSLRSSMTPVGVRPGLASSSPACSRRKSWRRPPGARSTPITPMPRWCRPCGWRPRTWASRAAGCWSRAADRATSSASPPPART